MFDRAVLAGLVLCLTIATQPAVAQTPVEANGSLTTNGNHIVNERGEPVQLRGVATHGGVNVMLLCERSGGLGGPFSSFLVSPTPAVFELLGAKADQGR